ncbi:MAG TPA: hypothetical protein VK815_00205 [Candidatus Acidoferrales bacterium]|nr:hypothetical protein [Candidatus Acidoferrales bacterium]
MKANAPFPLQNALAPAGTSAGKALKCFKICLVLLLFPSLMSMKARALDRWTALAMLESGGDDHVIGRAGEISRYQIRPEFWPGGDPADASNALANAQSIMSPRLAVFARSHGRMPDDFEFYVLWNAPAQVDHPHHAVAERALRFVNLVGSNAPAMPPGAGQGNEVVTNSDAAKAKSQP